MEGHGLAHIAVFDVADTEAVSAIRKGMPN